MISYTETYDPTTDGLVDLALPVELDARLDAALVGDHRHEIRREIADKVTEQLQQHGVTSDGEWLGEWSAEPIVVATLERYETVTQQPHDDAVVMDGRLYQLLEGFIVAGMTGEFEDVQARPDGLLITLVDGSSWLLVAHPAGAPKGD